MKNFNQLACTLAAALDDAGIPYMIIGGLAVIIHGHTRFTSDLDITVMLNRSEIEPILAIARGAGVEFLVDDPEEFAKVSHLVPGVTRDELKVDIMIGESEYEKLAIRRAITIPTLGIPVRYAAVEDLVIHKLIAGRALDLTDVRALIVRHQDTFDFDYARQWLTQFDEAFDSDLNHNLTEILSDIGIRH